MKLIRTLAIATLLAASGNAFAAKTCKVELTGTDAMQFDKKEIAVAADCTDVEVTLHHGGKLPAQAMGLALAAAAPVPQVNLRKGEMAYRTDYSYLRGKASYLAAAVLAVWMDSAR